MKLNLNNPVFWCGNEERFLRMKEIMSDPAIWPDTYIEFTTKINELIESNKNVGVILTKIDADPEAFAAWCNVKRCAPDRKARIVYATEQFCKDREATN